MVCDGNGLLIGRGGTDGGGVDAIDGPVYVFMVRMLEIKVEVRTGVLKVLPAEMISASPCPNNTI
jgi:hypothetical protein